MAKWLISRLPEDWEALVLGKRCLLVQLCQMGRMPGYLGSKPSNSASSATINVGEWLWVIKSRQACLIYQPTVWKIHWTDTEYMEARDIFPKIHFYWISTCTGNLSYSTDVKSKNYQSSLFEGQLLSTEWQVVFLNRYNSLSFTQEFLRLWGAVLRWGTLLQATQRHHFNSFCLTPYVIFTHKSDSNALTLISKINGFTAHYKIHTSLISSGGSCSTFCSLLTLRRWLS